MDVKLDFSNWLLINGAESYKQYYGESVEEIKIKLDEINTFFETRDLFNIEKGSVEELKNFLTENIYGKNRQNNTAFFQYDELKGNGRPKAILGKNNYFEFLNTYPFRNSYILEAQIRKYQNAIDRTDWLKIHESYKFNFIKWIEEHIDFDNQTNEAIKAKIEESQQQTFSPNSNIKGVNFIKTIARYHDDYITIDDIERLRHIISNKISENKENLTLSFSSFPKTSAYLCLFEPNRFMAYDGESMPAYSFLSKGISDSDNPPKKSYKAFQFYQTFYRNIKEYLKTSKLNISTFKTLLKVDTLTELHWNFITQDFLLFITRRIMNEGMDIIDIKGNRIYKLSMGSFLKDKDYAHINPIEQFENNNLIVMHGKTGDNQGYDFINTLKRGDYIYLTYGQQRLSFIGKITEDSKPLNKVMELGLDDNWVCRSIEVVKNPTINNTNDLKDKKAWLPSGYSTFKEIKDIETANKVLFNKYYKVDIVDSKTNSLIRKTNFLGNIQPLNQILYGPPGTGKTYKTKKLAVEIIENVQYSDSKEDREIILEKYENYIDTENIFFTTFHQSMSYEDFIEGIKPKMDEDEEKEISYKIEDGIFKTLCKKASDSISNLNSTDKKVEILSFEKAWTHLIEDYTETSSNSNTFTLPTSTEMGMDIVGVTNKGNLLLKPAKGSDLDYTVSYNRMQKLFNAISDLSTISNIDKEFRKVIGGSNSTAYWCVLNYLHNWLQKNKEPLKVEVTEVEKKRDNYVIIIDEINRGNVSAIFGELITLIEKDKRAGENEAISVTLPYSKDKFSVPQNVFIIGTMNTADRSVEALDTALRRRFSFEEILPKPQLLNKLEYQDVNLELLLSIINQRIELLIDKDHQIGHSYFFNVNSLNDLKLVFKDKIIPLLEEYFYGDLGKIGLVLGEKFIIPSEGKNKSILAKFKDYNDIDFVSDKKVFKFCPINEMKEVDFISIYQSIEG